MAEVSKELRMKFKVKGVTYEGRQDTLARLKEAEYDYLFLERDPNNKYDKNAVMVMASFPGDTINEIGFVPAEIAQYLAGIIDRRGESFKPITADLYGGGGKPFGVKITLTIPEEMNDCFKDLSAWCPVCWSNKVDTINSTTGKQRCLKCRGEYLPAKYAISSVR